MTALRIAAAVFLGIAGIVSLVRYGKSKNNGRLFISLAFLSASVIFGYLAFGT